MSKRKLIFLGSLYVLISALSVGVAYSYAYAYNWTNSDRSFKAGNSEVYFHQCDLDPDANTHRAFHNNGDHDIGPTSITRREVHGCDTVDVRINGYAYGFGANSYGFGWYECHDFYAPEGCDKGHAHINVSYGFIPEDYADTLTVVCQEIGHSVGLGHRARENDTSCMSTVENRGDLTPPHLDSHDKAEINSRY